MNTSMLSRGVWVALMCFICVDHVHADNWPQFRGPAGDGVSRETKLPIKWGETENVIWKCAVPEGASTPTIWGDAIFLTAQDKGKLLLIRISVKSGTIEWSREVGTVPEETPAQKRRRPKRGEQVFHPLHNYASPSPATDGEVVAVHYGTGDTAAFDFTGKKLWARNLQKEHSHYTYWWGHANSPVLFNDLVINVCMQDSLSDLSGEKATSYVIAHDKRTGEERWKTMRVTPAVGEHCDSYTTPIFVGSGDGTQMVIMGAMQMDAYEPMSGRQIWVLPGLTGGRLITGPTFGNGMIYATQGFRGPVIAVKPDGVGQLKPEVIVWKEKQSTPDTCCPVLWDKLLFTITDNGIATCYDALTGKVHWRERFSGDHKASPIAVDGRIYFLNLVGKCSVVSASPRFEKVAENQLPEDTIASPAVAGGRLFIRGRKILYCIGNSR